MMKRKEKKTAGWSNSESSREHLWKTYNRCQDSSKELSTTSDMI